MKITIKTNKDSSDDLPLYFDAHCIQLIIDELLKEYGNYEASYNELLNSFQKSLIKKNRERYRYYGMEEAYEEKLFSLILSIKRELNFEYYATLLKIANKYNLEYIKLFILIDYKIDYAENMPYRSKLVFEKEDVDYIIGLLETAKKVKLLKTSKRVIQVLLEQQTGKEEKVKDVAGEFVDDLRKDIENIDYILFEYSDEFINDNYIYTRNFEINYKELLLSKEFQEYLKEDEDFDISEIESFDEYINNYLEEGGLNISEEIVNKIIKNKDEKALQNEKGIKDLLVKEESLI